jgi:Uma2 family endonuclease
MAQPAYFDAAWVDEDPPEAMPPVPPTQDELPSDDGEPMETQRHKWQMDILIDAMDLWLEQRGEGYVNGNMFVYFSLEQTRGKHFRGPDCFVVLGVPRGERKSWVVWEQGKAPDVVIELLSESTAAHDKGDKKQTYQDLMRVPEYFWFDPFHPEDRAGFRLRDGRYRPIEQDGQGRLPSNLLGLTLVLWDGEYRGIAGTWLRWATLDGDLLPTEAEAAHRLADRETARADEAEQRAGDAEQRAGEAERRAGEAEQRAEAERSRADAERVRAERAEAELARLRKT